MYILHSVMQHVLGGFPFIALADKAVDSQLQRERGKEFDAKKLLSIDQLFARSATAATTVPERVRVVKRATNKA